MKIGVVIHEDHNGRWLVPATLMDAEELAKLDPRASYTFDFSKMRNYEFHKKYFAMLKVVYESIDEAEKTRRGITNPEMMLVAVKCEVGHCDYIYVESYDSMCIIPKSISFAAMDEIEFQKFYDDSLDACLKMLPEGGDVGWRQYVSDAVMKLIGFM